MPRSAIGFFRNNPSWGKGVLLIAGLILIQAIILYTMGRVPICKCGTVEFWYGDANGAGNSQHLSDWYTFSHIIHGFLLYGLFHLLFPKMPLLTRLALSVGVEMSWEIVENTNFVINRYREGTISLDYDGDSIINSVADTAWMMLGFIMAARLPVWLIVVLALVFELGVGYVIRDNLTLNVIMLIYPLEAIRDWQAAGAGAL